MLTESLWHNDYIKIRQQTIVWNRWKNAGINHINDLLSDEQPRFCSHEELAEKYRITITFLDLLQIRAAIPCMWKRKIINELRREITPKPTISMVEDSTINILAKSSKTLYYTLLKLQKTTITSQLRWNEQFLQEEYRQHEYWSSIYTSPYKTALDTKLQAFYFRVVHRFLPCNRFLSNIRIKRDDWCSFCPLQTQ